VNALSWRLTVGAVVMGLGAAGYIGGRDGPAWMQALRGEVVPKPGEPARTPVDGGAEMLFVLVTSSTCAPSHDEELPQDIESLKRLVRQEAEQRGAGFSSLALSLDAFPYVGLRHLRRFGYFDEISTGRGNLGVGAQRYLQRDLAGLAATPQVLIISRELTPVMDGRVLSERVVERRIGLMEIRDWLHAGAPLSMEH